MRRLAAAAALLALFASCTPVGRAPTYIVNELAPTGKLRAAIDYGNPVLAQRDPKTSEARGVTVDLARELSWRLNVPVELIPYDAAGKVTADARTGQWDVAFVALDPKRAEDIAFTSPYMVIEGGIQQAMATPKDRERAAQYLQRFVEDVKQNGFVAAALERSGQKDASVAP